MLTSFLVSYSVEFLFSLLLTSLYFRTSVVCVIFARYLWFSVLLQLPPSSLRCESTSHFVLFFVVFVENMDEYLVHSRTIKLCLFKFLCSACRTLDNSYVLCPISKQKTCKNEMICCHLRMCLFPAPSAQDEVKTHGLLAQG